MVPPVTAPPGEDLCRRVPLAEGARRCRAPRAVDEGVAYLRRRAAGWSGRVRSAGTAQGMADSPLRQLDGCRIASRSARVVPHPSEAGLKVLCAATRRSSRRNSRVLSSTMSIPAAFLRCCGGVPIARSLAATDSQLRGLSWRVVLVGADLLDNRRWLIPVGAAITVGAAVLPDDAR